MLIIPLGRNDESGVPRYGTLVVDNTRFNETVNQYIYSYGLRQVLNDAMATKTDKDGKPLSDKDIRAKAEKRLDNLYEGLLRSRTPGEPSDPFEVECYREAKRTVHAALVKKGHYKDVPKRTKDRFMFVVNRLRAANGKGEATEAEYLAEVLAGPAGPGIRERAQANIESREADGDDILG